METVTYEQRSGIGFITLNRPDKLNAITDQMSDEVREALYLLDDDADAVVGIISGNGRSFCSGADVQQRQMKTPEEMARIGGPGGREVSIVAPMYRSTNFKPVISAVHGHCFGLGLLVALTSDIMVASEGAKFQITEVRRGLNGGHFWALLADRGWSSFADDVAITARIFLAEEAYSKGVIQHLTKPGEQLAVAEEIAREVQKNPPLSVRALVRERRARLEQIDAREYAMRAHNLHLTEDFRDSALAFVEKRPPVFRGR